MGMTHNTIGNNIKNLRKINNMKQEDLANRLCVARQALSNYECGKRVPDAFILSALADIFDVTVDSILGRSDFKNNNKK